MKTVWKKGITNMRNLLAVLSLVGWWGIIYPELVYNPDTCRIVWDESDESMEDSIDPYTFLLQTDGSHIRVRSRLYVLLQSILEK